MIFTAVFKLKHKLHISSGPNPAPHPREKFWLRLCLTLRISEIILVRYYTGQTEQLNTNSATGRIQFCAGAI